MENISRKRSRTQLSDEQLFEESIKRLPSLSPSANTQKLSTRLKILGPKKPLPKPNDDDVEEANSSDTTIDWGRRDGMIDGSINDDIAEEEVDSDIADEKVTKSESKRGKKGRKGKKVKKSNNK